MAAFPQDKDIQRLLDMKGYDYGFTALAIYAFIEVYMKCVNTPNFLELSRFQQIASGDEGKFKSIIDKFWETKFHGNPYNDRNDGRYKKLLEIKEGKYYADGVRHTFESADAEKLRHAIMHLISFCSLVGENELCQKFIEFRKMLSSWDNKEVDQNYQKEIDELNKRIQEFQQNHSDAVVAIEELEKAKKQLQESLENLTDENGELKKDYALLLDYIDTLKELTYYTRSRKEYEQVLLTPGPDQIKAIEQFEIGKDFLITGSAGTGKSFVLLKIYEKILEQNKICYLATYTNSLTNFTRFTANLLNQKNNTNFEYKIDTVDHLFSSLYFNCFKKKILKTLEKNQNEEEELANYLINRLNIRTYTNFIVNELINYIWPNLITEKQDYLDETKCPRDLMPKLPLGSTREEIWDLCSSVTNHFAGIKEIPFCAKEFARYEMAVNGQYSPVYDYILIDEAQDLGKADLLCLRNYCHNIVVSGDLTQSIYQPYKSWKLLNIQNTANLDLNYRNTIQITDFANKFCEKLNMAQTDSKGFRNGPSVEVYKLPTKSINFTHEHFKAIKNKIEMYTKELNYSPDNICIIATRQIWEVEEELKNLRIDYELVKNAQMEENGKIKLASIHSAKGLSFPVVLLIADDTPDYMTGKYKKDTVTRIQNQLYYVAITRAMDILNIFTLDKKYENCSCVDVFKEIQSI